MYSLGLSSAATSPLSEQEGSWMLMFYTRSPQRQSSYICVGGHLSVLAHPWRWGAHCPSKEPFPIWDSLDSWKVPPDKATSLGRCLMGWSDLDQASCFFSMLTVA